MKTQLLTVMLCFALYAEARLPDLIPYRKGDLWGFCDSTKKIIIAPQWEQVYCFGGYSAPVKKNDLWGLIDKTGKIILETKYYRIEEEYVHGLRIVEETEDGRYGAINDSGRFVVPLKYREVWRTGPYLQVYRRKGNCSILDSTGATVIPFGKYKGCTEGADCIGDSGLFVMWRKGKWGVIDTAGKVIIPFKHTSLTATSYCTFRGDTGWGDYMYYNTKGHAVPETETCPPLWYSQEYDREVNGMICFSEGTFKVGYKDSAGRIIYPPQFTWGYDFMPNGLAKVWPPEHPVGLMYPGGYIDAHGTKYWDD